MKKKALLLLLAFLLLLGASACGASASTASVPANANGAFDTADYAPAEPEESQPEKSEGGISYADAEQPSAADDSGVPAADKIIYSAYAEIETRDFDASVEGVYALIDRFGGFLETSSVTGNDYYASRTYRTASFVIRIPSKYFQELTGSLTELGNVPYSSTSAENITARYNDTQSRLDAYEIEYDRLLAMLEKAETAEDMLAIEARLSDVRYNIQSLSDTISGWDSLISYSTVELRLSEVVEYTEEPVVEQSYWEEVSAAFSATLKGLGRFFKGLFKGIVAFAPILAIAGVTACVVVLIMRGVRRGRLRKSVREEKKPDDGKE